MKIIKLGWSKMEEQDQEDYRSKGKLKKLSMKQIILQQIKTIMDLGSIEMRGGYEEETIQNIDGQPQLLKRYIEDGRQAYINAVSTLEHAVVSYVIDEDKSKQKNILNSLNEIKKEQEELYKDYLEELEVKDAVKQKVKFEYFTLKKQIYEKIFQKLMRILKRSDFFDEDEKDD